MKTPGPAVALLSGALILGCVHEHRDIRVGSLPPELPPPVYVEPDVAVVPGIEPDIFFAFGYWWYRAPDGLWYRTLDPYGTWAWVPDDTVPRPVAVLPPGRYHRWYPSEPAPRAHERERGEERGEGMAGPEPAPERRGRPPEAAPPPAAPAPERHGRAPEAAPPPAPPPPSAAPAPPPRGAPEESGRGNAGREHEGERAPPPRGERGGEPAPEGRGE